MQASEGSKSRDTLLDVVRGLCLVVMAINHLPANAIRALTISPLAFYNSSFGFVIISGYVAGWRFTKTADRGSWWDVARRVLRRTGTLVIAHQLVATLVALAATTCGLAILGTGLTPGAPVPPLQAWASSMLFVDRIPFLWILTFYIVLIPIAAIVLPVCDKGYGRFLVLLSACVWALRQWTGGSYLPLDPVSFQLLFVIGLWLGHRRARNLSFAFLMQPAAQYVAIAAFAGAFLFRHAGWFFGAGNFFRPDWRAYDFGYVGAFTLLSFLPSILIYGQLRSRWGSAIGQSHTGRFLAHLGRNSLAFFAVHVVCASLVFSERAAWERSSGSLKIVYTVAVVAATILLTVAVNHLMTALRHQPLLPKVAGASQKAA